METNIIYQYRVPRAAPGYETTITPAALDLNPNEVLTSYHMVGETITLQADVPKDYGEDPWEKRRQRVQQPSPYVLSILRTLFDRRHYVALGHQGVRQFFD